LGCVVVVFLTEESMTTLDLTRAELALIVLYLNKAEARDKICRAIQYGSKFLSGGQPGTAQTVDKNTSLARKVFRLFKVMPSLLLFLSLFLRIGTGFIVASFLLFGLKMFSKWFRMCSLSM